MAIAEFPLPSASASNPPPSISYQLPEKYQVDSTEYDDGGRDVKLQHGGNGIKRWVLRYIVLNQTWAAILDSHAYAAKLSEDGGPSGNSFNYRDPETGILYTGVRYLRYERPAHQKRHIQSREVELVKFP